MGGGGKRGGFCCMILGARLGIFGDWDLES